MSSLPGHARITSRAVNELSSANKDHPIYSALGAAGLPTNVIARDIIDVLIGGHWADFGQCHHFMRRFDGQSEKDAHAEAVAWIQKNALDAARTLCTQIRYFYGKGGIPAGPPARNDPRGIYVLAGEPTNDPEMPVANRPSWQCLGNAVHATQDSFAWGHAERETPSGNSPGAIQRVKRYAGSEKDGHKEADDLWFDKAKNDFSQDGRFAIDATKDLLKVVVDTALTTKGGSPAFLAGFASFQTTWLAASPNLSSARDRAFDLIDKHYTGVRLGASNLKTVNMDEAGLAKDLYKEAAGGTKVVLDVFARLEKHYSSDADDVAEHFVNLVKKGGGAAEKAVAADKALVKTLIEVLDAGWTSSGEQACIDYLKKL